MMQPQRARVTTALVAFTCLAFLAAVVSVGIDWVSVAGGFIPARMSGVLIVHGAAPAWLTPLTATLVHASFLHLLFNMVMLGFCGKLVEEAIGARGMMLLYVVGAYGAALAHYLAGPHETIPMVGASGAASAVLGVYALLYGRHREAVAHPGLNRLINVVWLAVAWIGIQILFGYAGASEGMPIAIAAHIGGFLTGLVLARLLLVWRYRSA
jgi:membrane associated rhomboid family serine protease